MMDHYELLQKLEQVGDDLNSAEHELRKTKLEYDLEFIRLCNSTEFIQKFKTIKQREQTARVDLSDVKYDIISLQSKVDYLKGEIRLIEWQLRFLLGGGE